MLRSRSTLLPVVCLVLTPAPGLAAEQAVDFGRDILPILSDKCFLCHGPDPKARKANLRLDTKEEALRKTDPVIVPGKSSESILVQRITSHDPKQLMPPPRSNRKLSAHQIELLTRWIDSGAPWGQHWAFVRPRRPALPAVRDGAWPRNALDRFLLARLEAVGLTPSPEAPREALLRRLTLDLTGLPPTLAERDAFLADRSPDAYERVVDRLLASPHYGERMAWDWLDAARYADSNGYQGDGERTMWPWRDWAVSALNRNLPFDQFTTWQLAGDQLPGATREQRLATGFLRNHPINGEGGRIAEENRIDYVMDMTETTGTVWLGLTFNCCRCHDHKFDELKQRDYYSLFAFYNQTPVTGGGGDPQTPPVLSVATPEQERKLAELNEHLRRAAAEVEEQERKLFPRPEGKTAADSAKAVGLEKEVLAALRVAPEKRNRGQLERLEKQGEAREPAYGTALKKQRSELEARDGLSRSIPRVMVMEDLAKPRDTFMLTRGGYDKPGEKVGPATPAFLPPMAPQLPHNRLGLARWLTSTENPLTARVIVNRAWQQFFGIGLVKTPEDFGVQGEPPSNPQLLDWLAVDLVESGWDLKHLHRLIVTSAAYRQSSKVTPALLERDPQNRLLARGPRYRLPSWMIRDQALAVSGLLVPRLGGPPVRPYQPPGVWEEATFGTKSYRQDHGEALYRRSLYTFWRRIVGPTEFFDSASRQVCTVKQVRTNTPLHALAILNDPTYVEAARALAERVLTHAGPSDGERLDLLYRLVLCRQPTDRERTILLASLTRVRKEYADPVAARKLLSVGESKRNETLDLREHAAYTALCTAILNLDETLTRE